MDQPSSRDDDDKFAKRDQALSNLAMDSLARDPFVSISRAIQAAKLRASASMRNMSNRNQYAKTARLRYLYNLSKRLSRLFAAILLILIFTLIATYSDDPTTSSELEGDVAVNAVSAAASSAVSDASPSHNRARKPITSPPEQQHPAVPGGFLRGLFSRGPSPLSANNAAAENGGDKSLSAIMRHRPAAHRTPSVRRGPWLIALVADLDKQSCYKRDRTTGSVRPASCTHANAWVSFLKRGALRVRMNGVPGATIDASAAAIFENATAAKQQGEESTAARAQLRWFDEIQLDGVRGGEELPRYRGRGAGRGMELSELAWFQGHLLAPDDRTGSLLEVASPHGLLDGAARALLPGDPSGVPPSVLPRVALRDGDGSDKNGAFKAEWMVVKDDELYIGGHGKAYTDPVNGSLILSNGPKWTKVVSHDFSVRHVNWTREYDAVAAAMGVQFPGYLMHEAVLWSQLRREWVFLPRRRSVEAFDAQKNMRKGWHVALVMSEDFKVARRVPIEGLRDKSGLRGFSSAKFVPGTGDRLVVGLRTVEVESELNSRWSRETASFVSVFDLMTGKMVLEEEKVSDKKYEGFEIL